MTRGQSAVIVMGLAATAVNMFGAVRKAQPGDPNPTALPLFGGLVVTTALLAAAGPLGTIAEAFAAAYLVTSVARNGNDLIDLVTGTTSALRSKSGSTVGAAPLPTGPGTPTAPAAHTVGGISSGRGAA
jgi:hypothetical protein